MRISQINWIVSRISEQVDIAAAVLEWIFLTEALEARAVVARPGVVKARGVVLHTGEQVGIIAALADGARDAEGLVLVLSVKLAGVGQCDGRTQHVGQRDERAGTGGIRQHLAVRS